MSDRVYVLSTAKVIQRQGLGLKSHPKDMKRSELNSLPLVYKKSSFTTTLQWFYF